LGEVEVDKEVEGGASFAPVVAKEGGSCRGAAAGETVVEEAFIEGDSAAAGDFFPCIMLAISSVIG